MRAMLAVLLFLLAGPVQAAGPLAHREVLPNGAVLLVAERPAIPIVVVRVGVPGGAVHDPEDALGVASLTAELLTRGTARRSGPELDRAIEFVGGSLEAGAGSDGAAVTLSVLKKDLALGLDLLVEVLRQPTFPADELARKVTDIQGALRRSEQEPATVAARELGRMIAPGHPYGRPAGGTIESVGKLTRDKRPGTVPRRDVPFREELVERQQRRRPRDGQLRGKRARRQQPRAGRKHTIEDCATQSAIDLLLQRFTRRGVDRQEWGRGNPRARAPGVV